MTDNEIIKALKCCGRKHNEKNDTYCKECHSENGKGRVEVVIDLINRQKAEIEKIKKKTKKLKYFFSTNGVVYVPKFIVDNLVKEVTEVNENEMPDMRK